MAASAAATFLSVAAALAGAVFFAGALAGAFFVWPLLHTALRRNVDHIYVTGWYYLGALCWFPILFFIANLPGIHSGVQEATVNWWFAHNVLGLWLTPLGVGAA